jgi:hypothetical protein
MEALVTSPRGWSGSRPCRPAPEPRPAGTHAADRAGCAAGGH